MGALTTSALQGGKTKLDRQFDAILAKNDIARELRESIQNHEEINVQFVWYCLNEIEASIGTLNQPCVNDIIKTTEYEL